MLTGNLGVGEAISLLDEFEILKGLDVVDPLSWEDPLFPIFDVSDCFLRFVEFLEVLVMDTLDDILGVPEPWKN